jgi:hypothetical protein
VKVSQLLEEAFRAWKAIPLFVLPFALLVVLASSTSGDHHFCEIVTLFRPIPHQDWGRARPAGNRFARDEKEPGSRLGKQLPENGLVKLPRRTLEPSAQPVFWEERRRSAYRRREADFTRHKRLCAVRLLTFFANVKLELELIKTQMEQKPMQRAEVYAIALRASQKR